MESDYTITTAKREHLEALSGIELAAATMFEGYVPHRFPKTTRGCQNSGALSVREGFGSPSLVKLPSASPSSKCWLRIFLISRRSMLLRLMAVVGSELL